MPELEQIQFEQPSQQPTVEQHIIIKRIWKISEWMIAVGATALGIMMFLSVADIGGRYFFLRPIEGTSEIVAMLLVVASAAGLGWCQLLKGNIRIDILTARLSPRWQAILDIFSFLLSVAVCVVVVWQGSLMTIDYVFRQLGGRTATLGVILWPFIAIMTLGFLWVTVVFFLDLIDAVKRLSKLWINSP